MFFDQERIFLLFYSSNRMSINIIISGQKEKITGNMRFCAFEGMSSAQLFLLDYNFNGNIESGLNIGLPVLSGNRQRQ